MGVSMEYIQSKDNKTIKRIISLGQRKNRQKYGEYIVEGIRSIRDIAAMGAVKTIVIRESKAQDKHVLDLLDLDTVQFVPKFIAQDPIFDKVDNTVGGQPCQFFAGYTFHSFRAPVSTDVREDLCAVGQQMAEEHSHAVASIVFGSHNVSFTQTVPVE